jgi:hypothetical protein
MWKNILIAVLTVMVICSGILIYDWSTNLEGVKLDALRNSEEAQRREKVALDMYNQELEQRRLLDEKLKLCEAAKGR